jgi:hypothetical protein
VPDSGGSGSTWPVVMPVVITGYALSRAMSSMIQRSALTAFE